LTDSFTFFRGTSRTAILRALASRVSQFNGDRDAVDIQRLDVTLEPQAEYELHPSRGGCEDPRVTPVPRIALAASNDLFHWERLGLATAQNAMCVISHR
jgi:hypothetical protein